MRLRFWGTRGSLARPGPTTLRYGGNTSCVELRTQGGTLVIFDCGTGARDLGLQLLQDYPDGVSAAILIGHTHWDHIQGFPFFAPIFMPSSSFTIYAPTGGDTSLADVLAGQMEYTYFPVSLDHLHARISFQALGETTFQIGDATVRTQYLNHTALTLAYRVTAGGVTVVYATDHEPNAAQLWHEDPESGTRSVLHQGDQRHIDFLRDADLLIHDAQYTEQEYADKRGWGHSPIEYVVDVAAAAEVKRLALFHHDPSHDDALLDRLVASAQRRAETQFDELAVFGAAEGRWVALLEHPEATAAGHRPAAPSLSHRPRILIAEDDPDLRAVLVEILGADDYELVVARDGREALALALGRPIDLALLDLRMPLLDGREVLRGLREEPRTCTIPVIILTASSSEDDIISGFEVGATDYITKPFAPSMVRTRVRSWLLRSEAGRQQTGDGL